MSRPHRDRGSLRRVLVGFDDRWRSRTVLAVAALEARRRGLGLAVVTVIRPRFDPERSVRGMVADERRAREVADRRLAHAVDLVREGDPLLDVTAVSLTEAEVAAGFVPLSGAGLLVVGSRSRFGGPAFGLESVSRLLLRATGGDVLVVPDDLATAPADAPVVAAVGHTPTDAAVAVAAIAEGRRLHRRVVLLHVCPRRGEEDDAATVDRGRAELEDLLAGAPTAPGGPRPELRIVVGTDVRHAIGSVDRATRVVVGSRAGSLSGLVLGSVSHDVMSDAVRPVLVVRSAPVPGPDLSVPLNRSALGPRGS